MTNIKYLKENNLYEAHKHFMRLSEAYIPTFPEEELEEAGDDQDPMGGGADPMGGGAPGGDPMGGGAPGGDPMGGGDPNAMGGDPGMGGDPMGGGAPGGDPMGGGDPNAMGGDPMGGGAPDGDPMGGGDPNADPMGGPDMGMDDPMGGGPDEEQNDGDTIDIDGLTKAEDKLNIKQNQIGRDLAKVDTKISSLIDTISNLQSALDSNSSELENLKAEFEKRNPTQTEKLDIRGALDSYPFNVTPGDFWANKMKEKSNYEVYGDNDESTEDQYTITADDVDDLPTDISDSFSIDDDDIQTLEKMFKL